MWINKTKAGWLEMLCCILLNCTVQAQGPTFKRNVIYAEAEHRKPFYSINYERIIYSGAIMNYSIRGGLGIAHRSFYTPIGLSAFVGKKAHHLSLECTLAPYNVKYTKEQRGSDHVWDTYLYVFPAIGYRYQKPLGRMFFRVSASPGVMMDIPSRHLLEVEPEFTPTLFAAMGVAF